MCITRRLPSSWTSAAQFALPGPVGVSITEVFSRAGGRCTRQEEGPVEENVLWNPSRQSAQCGRCPVRRRGRYLPVSKHSLQFSDSRHYHSDTGSQKSWTSASLMDDFSSEGGQFHTSPTKTGPTFPKQQLRQFGSGEDLFFPSCVSRKMSTLMESKWCLFSLCKRRLWLHVERHRGAPTLRLCHVQLWWDDWMWITQGRLLCLCVCVLFDRTGAETVDLN